MNDEDLGPVRLHDDPGFYRLRMIKRTGKDRTCMSCGFGVPSGSPVAYHTGKHLGRFYESYECIKCLGGNDNG